MDLVQRLDGYLNQQIMHSDPIPLLPPKKTTKGKKDTTLLDMALKALLKERMFGNLQNFQTQNVENKIRFQSRKNSIVDKRILNSSVDEASHLQNSSVSKSNNKSICSKKKQEPNTFQKVSVGKRLSLISSSFDVLMKKTQQRKFRLMSEKKVRFADQNLSKYMKSSQNQYIDTHFISSIQFEPTEKTINFSNKVIEGEFKLPQIQDKRKMKNSRLQSVKISKALFRQNVLKINVKQEFWSFICDKKDQRIRRNKEHTNPPIQSYLNLLQQQINLSTLKKLVPLQNSNFGGALASKKQLYKYNQNLVFKKQNFLNFIQNQKLTIPPLVSNILSFFQLSNKFTDKATKNQFQSIFTQLYKQPDRAWCFAIFYFLDSNLNTQIDSSDLFKVYNTIDSSKNIVQNYLDSLRFDGIKQIQDDNEPTTQKKIRSKRQKTLVSQNGSLSHRSEKKITTKLLIEFPQMKKIFYQQQNVQNQISLIKENLENIIKLQKQIQVLNEKIILRNSSFTNQKLSQNPQSNSWNKNISGFQKIYLQQGLLGKKDVKISQLGSVLQQVLQQNKMKKKKVLDIDHKKLNVKLSSGYVQTFIAINHNEETRINREYLQNLKDKVKKMSEIKNLTGSENIRNSLSAIQYTQFYEQKLFIPFKNLFFEFVHILIQNK